MDKTPCDPDCPRRSGTCHADCPDYAIYADYQAEKRKAKQKTARATDDLRAERRAAIAKHYHNKRK